MTFMLSETLIAIATILIMLGGLAIVIQWHAGGIKLILIGGGLAVLAGLVPSLYVPFHILGIVVLCLLLLVVGRSKRKGRR